MNECSCIYVEDYDSPKFHNAEIRKARKEHKCCECNRAILPKEKYEYVTGLWEGDIKTHKTCLTCLEIRSVFFCDGWFYGQSKEYLQEHISEMDGEIPEDCLSELESKAREYICDLIEKYWDRHDI